VPLLLLRSSSANDSGSLLFTRNTACLRLTTSSFGESKMTVEPASRPKVISFVSASAKGSIRLTLAPAVWRMMICVLACRPLCSPRLTEMHFRSALAGCIGAATNVPPQIEVTASLRDGTQVSTPSIRPNTLETTNLCEGNFG